MFFDRVFAGVACLATGRVFHDISVWRWSESCVKTIRVCDHPEERKMDKRNAANHHLEMPGLMRG